MERRGEKDKSMHIERRWKQRERQKINELTRCVEREGIKRKKSKRCVQREVEKKRESDTYKRIKGEIYVKREGGCE